MNRSNIKRPEDLLANPAFLITDVARLYRTAFDVRMKPLNLGRSEWWLMTFLAYFEGSTQQELAAVMDLTPGGMGKLIDRLEADGLVTRRSHDDDRRTRRVFLTESSKPVVDEVDKQARRLVARSIAPLSTQEVATLVALLTRMRQAFPGADEEPLSSG